MKKHPLRYGYIAVIISILFFLAAFTGLFHLLLLKVLSVHFHLHADASSVAYKLGRAIGLYIFPLFLGFVGWLLFQFGSEKLKLFQAEESDS